jgi:hypothetical protein
MHSVGNSKLGLAPIVLGIFGFGKKKTDETAAAPAQPVRRVILQGAPPAVVPTPMTPPPTDALKQRLLFQGLHEDTNPSGSVRVNKMTCPSCSTEFKYFVNSDGKKTVVNCPLCAKQYRL